MQCNVKCDWEASLSWGCTDKILPLGLRLILICLILSGCTAEHSKEDSSSSSGQYSKTTFQISREVQILPFATRLAKLKRVAGDKESLFIEIQDNRYELGDFDFAQGIGQDLTWTQTRMNIWIRSLQPICSSSDIKVKYPFSTKAQEFLKVAYGREPTSTDQQMIDQVAAQSASDDERTQIFCTVVLASLEFVHL